MLLASLALGAAELQAEPAVSPPKLALGYTQLPFALPEPGSYELPDLGLAADGSVLDSESRPTTLYALLSAQRGQISLLSFIYAACSDVNGCPLSTMVFHKIKSRLQKEPDIAKNLHLLTLSFNPEHDTPAMMKHYGQSFQGDGLSWQFLTTHSEQDLHPILDHYQQNIQKIYNAKGEFTGTFSHLLRVYLIDANKRIRNIYSVDFLHPDTLINDVRTLLLATAADHKRRTPSKPVPSTTGIFSAGDNKTGYEQADYQTHAIALSDRKGKAADLLANIRKAPLGLPPVPVPEDNPPTAAKIALGRKLFYDRRLSLNKTFSCAMCHLPEQGFTSQEMATAVGVEGRSVGRNTPSLFNVAYAQTLFHDARENTLEQQVWGPLLARNEMANPAIASVVDTIKENPDYPHLFKAAFGKPANMETIGMAIASYERALISGNSAFDRWYFQKQSHAMTADAQRGFGLFTGKAGCANCHLIGKQSALLTDQLNHNTGIGYQEAMGKPAGPQPVQIAPGVFAQVSSQIVSAVSERQANDLGRYAITQNPQHRWQYKTPSLRNLVLTAPYMHNGSLQTLAQVVAFYNQGGVANENLDGLIKPLALSAQEQADLVAFMQALTGDNVDELVSDAFAAPIGESQ
ncbi:hypothetical protein JCM14076_22320 [Methylosoma difficile]